ncbi:MAG: ATP-binding cassette domain-containing protein [Phycisphaerae bacterium]|nr:ATP-binding cassette domain-containing protein [Phycisphaerae bacterium]
MTHDRLSAPVVECISLTKIFQDFWGRDKVLAVDELDLEIRPGEVFGLLGPNGSGKSTTIKMLLGLLYPTSGAARVFGRPPTDTAVKARIGFMPEESYLYQYLNAHETLDYYGRLFKLDRHERRRRTGQLIDMVGLKRAARRPVGTYSKGMARRIGLAQALINDPDLLILDEPTTGLDPVGTRQIKDVIGTLGRRGKTVLLCSHLLADVEDVCDRVAIMYGGRRQALGSVVELLERQDITQITTEQLDEDTVRRIREIVAKAGRKVMAVDHPTDRLEEMFLRVVGQAQRERLQTSGAESTAGVSEFLAGEEPSEAGVCLVESLVQAGAQTAPEAAPDIMATKPVKAAPQIRGDVLAGLTGAKPSEPPAPVSAVEEPVESPSRSNKPDQAVLDRLLAPKPTEQARQSDSKDQAEPGT